MARLIPDFISDECKSSAERRIFSRFRNELSDEYIVLHSLGVARHRYKLYSEADFILVHPRAVIVFEIKGGRIARKDGCWFFTDRYGQTHKRRESPMQQAASVSAALRNSIRQRFGSSSAQARVAFGSVTFFPDIDFTEVSPEWDPRRVYDLPAWNRPLMELIADAMDYSRAEMFRITSHDPQILSSLETSDLIHFLRGDFEKLPTLNVGMDEHEDQMIRLAVQQYSVLDRISKNKRMVIEGCAGSGKTLLAVECARRHAAQGRRVLFVCFNRLLADHLESYCAREGLSQGVSIDTLHGHCLSVIRAAGIKLHNDISERELFQEHIPSLIPTAVAGLTGFKPWDILVVDEGQDIAAYPPFVAALNPLFVGGFAEGRWTWFEDPRQRILQQSDQVAFDLTPYSPFYFQLNRNWRNTNEIATFTCVSTMTALPELSGIEGPKVKSVVCDDQEIMFKLEQVVEEILHQGAHSEHIILLTAGAESDALFASAATIAGKRLHRYNPRHAVPADAIRYSSVFRFKGLESKIIILADISDLRSNAGRMAAYVGMSRAKSVLFVLTSKVAHQQFEENRLQFADLGNSRSSN